MLTELFKQAAEHLGVDSKVFTTDMNPLMAPAGYVSDGCFEICRCSSPDYVEALIKLCKSHAIGVVVPTIDTELLVLSETRERFQQEGIHVMVSDVKFIKACRDKRLTSEFMQEIGISVPAAIDKYSPRFPMFAKPYDGSLSTNLHVIRCKEELTSDILNDSKLLFMEYIDPKEFKEFTVDMYYGRDNRVKCIVPRERIKIRAGEINKGITRKNAIVDFLKERMTYLPGVRGTICLQLFFREGDGKIYGIEINPRFGGGYPLSCHAGANFPQNMLREYFLQEEINYTEDWKEDMLMLRYDREVIVHEGKGYCF